MADDIMKYETTLPNDFTGVFYFTNPSDEEFVATWNSKQYHFPAQSTSPMIMPDHSPLEIQHIRKKFARDLAEREFFKSPRYEQMRRAEGEKVDGVVIPRLNSIHQGVPYSVGDLKPYIQACLKPLEQARAFITPAPRVKDMERVLSRDDNTGELNTVAVDKKLSLTQRALQGNGLPTESTVLNAPPVLDNSNPVTVPNDAP
jgi:hypothetical protein